jgi:hypothetical protein
MREPRKWDSGDPPVLQVYLREAIPWDPIGIDPLANLLRGANGNDYIRWSWLGKHLYRLPNRLIPTGSPRSGSPIPSPFP